MKTIIKKVLIGQVTINPVLTSAFYVGINLLEGKHDLFEEVREKFGTTYAASWVIWPVAMFITFRLVPPHYRPAAIAITGFAWANFLCYMKTFNMHRTDLKPLGSSTKLSSVDAERILIPNKCSALKQEPTI
ncbi:mpv17-like protein [Saccoglossus kowalevskii]|uniref:Mpv17-like protein-like n=1 Tax=Saccoglossus kowalevskii TaxID=10224 RepID=A0ABM0LVP0_SACKO|nr:PREDICTED: mpv17-like protein-like [Saccoglossus kowalevskii]